MVTLFGFEIIWYFTCAHSISPKDSFDIILIMTNWANLSPDTLLRKTDDSYLLKHSTNTYLK
jgi:hypothetical protein